MSSAVISPSDDASVSRLTEFQDKAASASYIRVMPGRYVVDGVVSFLTDQVWDLSGAVLVQTGTTLSLFSASLVDGWQVIGPAVIVGPGGTGGSAVGLNISACQDFRVNSLTVQSVNGTGVLLQGDARTSGSLASLRVQACDIGVDVAAQAEYTTFTAPMIHTCGTGARIAGGNTTFVGGTLTANTTGLALIAGVNDAHGICSGVNINHNTTPIQATGITNGFTFAGCHIYEGPILIDKCRGLYFDGGTIDVSTIQNNNSDGTGDLNGITNAYLPGSYSMPLSVTSTDGHAAQFVVTNCHGPAS